VGYYVNNEYADEQLREQPPAQVDVERVARNILAEKPRVTRFPCSFDDPALPTGDDMMGQPGAEGITTAGFGDAYPAPAMAFGMMETSQEGLMV